MSKRLNRNHRAFTLIELVIVITILAILAAVAIPAFQNLTARAKDAGVQGALGGLRSAIAIYRANRLAEGLSDVYPSEANMNAAASPPNPMENAIVPDNPWCRTANTACDPNSVVSGGGTARGIVGSSAAGWAYDPSTGLIYANSSSSTSPGVDENTF